MGNRAEQQRRDGERRVTQYRRGIHGLEEQARRGIEKEKGNSTKEETMEEMG